MTLPQILSNAAFQVTPQALPVTQAFLTDLQSRLVHARFGPSAENDDWQYGFPSSELKRLVSYWKGGFDWRPIDRVLSMFESSLCSAVDDDGDGFKVHTLSLVSTVPPAATLLMIHGWPGSALDYAACAQTLAQSSQSLPLDILIVSPPGFGLSSPPSAPVNARKMARAVAAILEAAPGPVIVHGNDWGASIASWLAVDRPELVAGIHLGMMGLKPWLSKAEILSEDEQSWLGTVKRRLANDNGYAEIQSTVPMTMGAALADSPLAVLSWVAEKYLRWSSSDPRNALVGDDAILAQATLHWAANDLPSAAWIYWAERHNAQQLGADEKCTVPTGFTFCEGGFFPPPPSEWCARAHDVVFSEILPTGGHFGAWLQPQAYAASIERFYKEVLK